MSRNFASDNNAGVHPEILKAIERANVDHAVAYGDDLYTERAVKNGMFLHMDGARVSNAAASLGSNFKKFTVDAGVDVLSFGGTKNGLLAGEAVVFFDKSLARDFLFKRKQAMQLASKMRFISV